MVVYAVSCYKRDPRKVMGMFMSHERSITCLCPKAVYECFSEAVMNTSYETLQGGTDPTRSGGQVRCTTQCKQADPAVAMKSSTDASRRKVNT